MRTTASFARPARPMAAALAALLALAACGGGSDGEPATDDRRTAAAAPVIAPLLDDEGRVMPSDPAAVPADPGAHTRAGRYATPAQAEQLEHTMGSTAISTEVDSGGDAAAAADLAVLHVHGQQASHGLGNEAPVLVRGADLRLAAAVANRLQANGYTRVFLVTP